MKSLWGMLKARRQPFRCWYVIKAFHPDAFVRDVPEDDLPGNQEYAASCSLDTRHESLAVVEVMVAANVPGIDAAMMLRQIAEALEHSGNKVNELVSKRYSVKERAFVEPIPYHLRYRRR